MTDEEFRKELEISSEQAHRKLFEIYCNYVYTIVFNRLRSCASHEDIEECICDVFADVYIYYDKCKDVSGDISGFIGTIARRKAYVFYKKSFSAAETVSIDDDWVRQIGSNQNVENETENDELQMIILEKIAELGEPDSTIIIQKYYYGRTSKEISEMLSITPEHIRVRNSRAVRKLKDMLEHEGISL